MTTWELLQVARDLRDSGQAEAAERVVGEACADGVDFVRRVWPIGPGQDGTRLRSASWWWRGIHPARRKWAFRYFERSDWTPLTWSRLFQPPREGVAVILSDTVPR